jgi:hypothetical protein
MKARIRTAPRISAPAWALAAAAGAIALLLLLPR